MAKIKYPKYVLQSEMVRFDEHIDNSRRMINKVPVYKITRAEVKEKEKVDAS